MEDRQQCEHNRQRAMEDLHRGQTAVSCQMCEKSNQIKWKYINCDYLLCTNCYQLHRKVKSLDEHKIVDIKDVASHGKESVNNCNFKNIVCTNHLGQLCCFFLSRVWPSYMSSLCFESSQPA